MSDDYDYDTTKTLHAITRPRLRKAKAAVKIETECFFHLSVFFVVGQRFFVVGRRFFVVGQIFVRRHTFVLMKLLRKTKIDV